MKKQIKQLAFLSVLALASNAQAALYSDRSSFEAASQNLITTDFEGLIGTPGYPVNYLGVGTYNPTSAGITAGGMKFVGYDSVYGYGTYLIPSSVAGGALSLNGSTTLVMNSTSADIILPTGISAFGTDFGFSDVLKKTGPVDVTFHLNDGTSESLTLDSAQFFAYTGKLIDSIHFDARGLHYPNIDYLMLDNVSIGQVKAVPEPATYALMLAGLLAVRIVARRRQP